MEKEFKGIYPQCQEDEVYSETLTQGLCINCYQQNEEETRLMETECRLDYYQG